MEVYIINNFFNCCRKKIIDHDFVVPYYPESDESKVPFKASSGSAGYDLYSAEEKNILAKSCELVSLDLRWEIPEGFFGKRFSCSGLFLNHLVTAEGGVIDSDYRGIAKVILFNHSDQIFSVKMKLKIAQVVFMEKIKDSILLADSFLKLQKEKFTEEEFYFSIKDIMDNKIDSLEKFID